MIRGHHRVLAIDLTARGFSYAMFGNPDNLLDWGTTRVTADKHEVIVTDVKVLLDWYGADFLVLQDLGTGVTRRPEQKQRLSQDLRRLAEEQGLDVVLLPWRDVQGTVGLSTAATKVQLATALVRRYPMLQGHRPPVRKAWMSEDDRTNIFDAVALGVTAYELSLKRTA